MRGSVYYQSTQLTRVIFQEGLKKKDRIDPGSPHYQKVSSYQTMGAYRAVWENMFNYIKEQWQIKNCELINEDHVVAYMLYKIEYYPSKQYLEKINSAMGKLEAALNYYSASKYEHPKVYDFSKRQNVLDTAKDLDLIAGNYHNRAYKDPQRFIDNLSDRKHQLAAKIQLEGGARLEGVSLIKQHQLKGYRFDKVTQNEVGVIETKEKGGKVGDVLITKETYECLLEYLGINKLFRIHKTDYMNDIKNSATKQKIEANGSHGLRWNFAQRRLQEYAKAGYFYEQCLQAVSWEMKHNRASITEHYLGG